MVNFWIINQTLHFRKIECSLGGCMQLRSLLPLVFDSHKAVLIDLLFFLDSSDPCRALNIVCLERDCLGVHSRCPWTLSLQHVICADRSPYSGVILIDLRFSWLSSFRILCVLYLNGHLVDYAQDIAFKEDTVELVSVSGLWTLLHLAFHSHKVVQIHLWFFLVSSDWYRVFEMVYLERDYLGVYSRCPLLLSMTHVIRVHCGYPISRVLTRSLILLLHDLFDTI